MADHEEGKVGKYREEHPVYNKFYSNAEDVVFSKAPPLTEADKKKAALVWDALAQKGTSQGKKVPGPDEYK